MQIEQLMKLIEAGFTKEEIYSLSGAEVSEAPKEEPKEEPKEAQKEEPKQEAKEDPGQDLLKLISGEFEKLTKALISSNISGSNMNLPEKKDPSEILASIVDPDGSAIIERRK